MTPQEFREKRLNILEAMLQELSPSKVMIYSEEQEWLDALETLDKDYAAAQHKPETAFYLLLNSLDAHYKALLQSQGRMSAQRAVLDGMMSEIVKYVEHLPTEETK